MQSMTTYEETTYGNNGQQITTSTTSQSGGNVSAVIPAHAQQSQFSQMVSMHAQPEGRVVSTVRGEERFTGQTSIVATRMGERHYTGETRIVGGSMGQAHATGETRVIGHEKGIERQISVAEVAVGEEIMGETTKLIGRGRRGKKVIREEVIEKVIIVPETIQIEEWIEDEYDMEETVVEVAKKYQIEKTVEVPEIEIVEKIIEQIEIVIREKIIEVPKIETVEKIVEVPVIQTIEKIVEVPEVQYNDIPVERIVEIPDIQTQEVVREVKKANFVDKSIDQIKLVANASSAHRKLPVPVEAETVVEFTVAAIKANYVKKKFPVYLPRFIEVPVSRQFVDAGIANENDKLNSRISNLANSQGISLCEMEKLASEYKQFESTHRLTDKKASASGAPMPQQQKEALFRNKNINMEQYALYKNLPIEVGSIHWGKYNAPSGGMVTTYTSAQFGMSTSGHSSSHGSHTVTTSSQQYSIGGGHSTGGSKAFQAGMAIGNIASKF